MTSTLDKDAIFKSIPKSVTIGVTTYAAHVEYADRGKAVNEILKTSPVAVTLRYYADHQDVAATPGNRQLGKTIVGNDIKYTNGQKRQVTLSINVHVKKSESVPADKIISAYVGDDKDNGLLLTWLLQDLPAIVEVVDDTGISDLTYLENGIERRQMDIILRYERSYTKTVGTIDTVDNPDFTLA
jgi:hypothetical protein